MAKKLVKWRVADAPTGRFRSFLHRGWPLACYTEGGAVALQIDCEDDYVPVQVKEGRHGPITVRVADHSQTPWQWCRLKATFATLADAKAAGEQFLEKNPQFQPKKETTTA